MSAGSRESASSTFHPIERRRAERRHGARQAATAEALEAADAQRRRLARSLHDDTIQTLLAAIQDLEQAKREAAHDSASSVQSAQRTIELLTASVRQLRETVSDYAPSPPVGLALADGVQLLAAQAAKRGDFTCAVKVGRGPAGANRIVHAVVRELLANVAKHAQATRATVDVEFSPPGKVRIVVVDDGVGVSPDDIRNAFMHGHIGLPLLAARVDQQGGTFDVEGQPGCGTRVTIVLPLRGN